MGETKRKIALVNVIRTYANVNQPVDQFTHHMNTIVHAAQEHRLIAQLHAGIRQKRSCPLGIRGDLIGVIEVRVNPNRMVFPNDLAKFGGDPLWKYHGCACAYPDDFDVIDCPKFGEDVFQAFIAHQQGIATRKQHIPHCGCFANVINAGIDLGACASAIFLTSQPAAGAVPAVHGALVGY